MSDAVSFVEIDGQLVEVLPTRTVMSMFALGHGGVGGAGGKDAGGIVLNALAIDMLGGQTNTAGDGVSGAGGSAHGGRGWVDDNWLEPVIARGVVG